MQTGTARRPTDARNYVLRGLAASLALFGLIRLHWAAAHVILPVTQFQAGLADRIFGTAGLPVDVTLACSGADALALSLGAIAAYPVSWPSRLIGAIGGIVLLLSFNTARIGTLARVVASPDWFNALHLYVWPAILTLVGVGYVFGWMRLADGPRERNELVWADHQPRLREVLRPSRQFVALTVAFVVIFIAAAPLYLDNAGVLALAGLIAQVAAAILRVVGVQATATANVLWTSGGGVLVTQECISTPLVPVYLAAVCTYSSTWRRMAFGIAATVPIFAALGIARLLIVAVPEVAASPIVLVHAFYQVLLGGVVVYVAAYWQHGHRAALAYAGAGAVAGALFIVVAGPLYSRLIMGTSPTPIVDPQGALAFLPAFQIGLYLALWIATFIRAGWRPFVAGLAVLGLGQVTGMLAIQALASEAITLHVRDVRAWAVAGPVLAFAMVINLARTRR